jgi:hypothetical protein
VNLEDGALARKVQPAIGKLAVTGEALALTGLEPSMQSKGMLFARMLQIVGDELGDGMAVRDLLFTSLPFGS